MEPKTLRRRFLAGVLLALISLSSRAAFAETALPQTAADHEALAKKYHDEAAAYRKEAAEHKEMADAYKKAVPAGTKGGGPNPWTKKMATHCGTIAKDAEALAADADKAAEYHTMRAKELQGK